MIYITGDIHGEIYPRFGNKTFPEQKTLTKDDFVIILGDFGLPWDNSKEDEYQLKELEARPFTTLFIDGNHENYDLLEQYPVKEWNGGLVHKISEHILHLMRGQIFTIENKAFFTFGGARSHDIKDGILDGNDPDWRKRAKYMIRRGKDQFRVNHWSWWEQETATKEEMKIGRDNLKKHQFQVDYVLTHTPPESIAREQIIYDKDPTAVYLDELKNKITFQKWYFGHIHENIKISDHMYGLYDNITKI